MSGKCLRPGGRPVQYSGWRKRQRRFTILPSAGKSSGIQKGLLCGGHCAPQYAVTMREAAEPADDFGMVFGIFEIVGIGRVAEQRHATELVPQMLRMHERQI